VVGCGWACSTDERDFRDRQGGFERNENRAMILEKFDSDTLSLHVLSIP
jgi:hypothetical protein